ncbi:tRNA dihydrouridine synthase DusB [Hahella sp. KA22]|uniref:tRNA dihydrouridine synthase DusB n=1 Tax=Hahella sp. KA22 TaxID=1628392 RepID=UPI000FDF292E|nr:tRNA dihydrouridine synthase DusB [Hahella sp. KA22]AZZ94431.1 tRNA dihydrouridine synthase DusB [Hahella sp. KA22]QAY57805.1 tRNA dihydrouridine synthase DusB [Hahella sp. KA22]
MTRAEAAVKIGPYELRNNLILAPMAGVTDRPFRLLCRSLGAGLAVSEMMAANPDLRDTRKSRLRMDHDGEGEPIAVQIAGAEPEMLAEAARYNVEHGAQIIDINMGCPAKKVCNKAAGSALLRDEALVKDILTAVVSAVSVPVTLKIRTGWSRQSRNGVTVARIAQDCGIQSLAVHGRTRECKYEGTAEYDTIAEIKQSVSIPVVANGDITCVEQARHVLDYTGVDALMIGRGAQGRPWIFREIEHFIATGERLPEPPMDEIKQILIGHINALHEFYGDYQGVRIARKHVGWYLQTANIGAIFKSQFNRLNDAQAQLDELHHFFEHLSIEGEEKAA